MYAIGVLEPRFPSPGVEREYDQLAGAERGGRPEIDLLLELLARPENRYLALELCWVLVVRGGDEISVSTSRAVEVDDLVAAAAGDRLTFVSGWTRRGGCLGAGSLEVLPAHLLTFTRDEFVGSMAGQLNGDGEEGGGRPADTMRKVVAEVLERIMLRARNQGLTPVSRAVNYLALRAPAVYALIAEQLSAGAALVAVDGEHTHTGARTLVDVQLVFRSRRTDLVSRYVTRVDVTEVFPFLVSPLQQSFDG